MLINPIKGKAGCEDATSKKGHMTASRVTASDAALLRRPEGRRTTVSKASSVLDADGAKGPSGDRLFFALDPFCESLLVSHERSVSL
jgi:hypothetical protein